MKAISLQLPRRLVFGEHSLNQLAEELQQLPEKRLFVVTIEEILPNIEKVFDTISREGKTIIFDTTIRKEPSYSDFQRVLAHAREKQAEVIIGIGGGSSLDVAKLVAALLNSTQELEEVVGINLLKGRSNLLYCVPTTSGTGSEVSPNAILLDETENIKKGVISPHLVPDGAFIDPVLTVSLPPGLTAATGMDALVHCIEVYTNKFAHPLTDTFALDGIRLIGSNLIEAVQDGTNLQARSAMALGSLYGGLGLGPVNTAAVHVLSYPLGGEFHIPHGVANAVLLPYVMQFNIPANVKRYADVALALGVPNKGALESIARAGVEKIFFIIEACGLPKRLSDLNIPREALPRMAQSAMTVTRLIKNNPRPLTLQDALEIYEKAY